MELKTLPQFTKGISGRTVTGIFAVHGNIDVGGDRSWPGSFADPKVGGRDRTVFLWQHDYDSPPVAKIDYIREVPRTELPESVLGYAPDATGGVEVSRTYLETPRGEEVLKGLQAGAIREMSYAYDATQYDYEQVGEGNEKHTVRNLRRVELYDVSDVNWGMNPATASIKAIERLLESGTPFEKHAAGVESVLSAFVERVERMTEARSKEGRTVSDANRQRIDALLKSLQTVSDDLAGLLEANAPKADPATVRSLFVDYQRLQAQLNGVLQ